MSTAACHCSHGKKLRAAKHSAGFLIPAAVLALLPKCPLCLVAWLSLLGLTIPLSAAPLLHTTLITLCLLIGTFSLIRYFRPSRTR